MHSYEYFDWFWYYFIDKHACTTVLYIADSARQRPKEKKASCTYIENIYWYCCTYFSLLNHKMVGYIKPKKKRKEIWTNALHSVSIFPPMVLHRLTGTPRDIIGKKTQPSYQIYHMTIPYSTRGEKKSTAPHTSSHTFPQLHTPSTNRHSNKNKLAIHRDIVTYFFVSYYLYLILDVGHSAFIDCQTPASSALLIRVRDLLLRRQLRLPAEDTKKKKASKRAFAPFPPVCVGVSAKCTYIYRYPCLQARHANRSLKEWV